MMIFCKVNQTISIMRPIRNEKTTKSFCHTAASFYFMFAKTYRTQNDFDRKRLAFGRKQVSKYVGSFVTKLAKLAPGWRVQRGRRCWRGWKV